MSPHLTVAKTALVAAGVGVLVLLVVFVFADRWYATGLSPLVLLVTPGAAVGLVSVVDPTMYFVSVVVVQMAAYAGVGVVIGVAIRLMRRRRGNAV